MPNIRAILYSMKVGFEHSNAAFLNLSRRFNPNDLKVSCEGKSFMITGANGAIGSVIAKEIASRGGEIHMVARNKFTASSTKSEIIKSTGNKNIYVHLLDLSESRQVYDFAKKFRTENHKLDALINVAGTRLRKKVLNSEGYEYTFAVNTLAPHILTKMLSPLLLESMCGKLIFLSASTMIMHKLSAEDPQLLNEKVFEPLDVYNQTKRQLVVLAAHYAKEYPDLFVAASNPGLVATPFTLDWNTDPQLEKLLRTPEQGADCTLWLAISDSALRFPSGCYFQNRCITGTHLPFDWMTKVLPSTEKKFVAYMDKQLVHIGKP